MKVERAAAALRKKYVSMNLAATRLGDRGHTHKHSYTWWADWSSHTLSSCAFSPEARSQQQPVVNSPDPHLSKNRPFGKDCHILCWSFLSTTTVPQHVCFQTLLPLTPDTLYPACSKGLLQATKVSQPFLIVSITAIEWQ